MNGTTWVMFNDYKKRRYKIIKQETNKMAKETIRITIDSDISIGIPMVREIFVFFRDKKRMLKREYSVYACCSTQKHNFLGGGSNDA